MASRGKRRKILFLVIYTLFVYGLLVVADFALSRYFLYRNNNLNPSAVAVESKRIVDVDKKAIKDANAKGFERIIVPSNFDTPAGSEIVERVGALPLGAQPDTPVILCNEGYGLITYTTDRLGFRNPNHLWDEPVDLLLIGDSYAHGACVKEADTISGRLLSNGVQTLNLASLGNNPVHYAAIAKSFIHRKTPKYVILAFYSNDNDTGDEVSPYYVNYFLGESRFLDDDTLELADAEGIAKVFDDVRDLFERYPKMSRELTLTSILKKSRRYLLLTTFRNTFNKIFHSDSPLFSTQLAINVAAEQCETGACKLMVLYIPNSDYWRPDLRAPQYRDSIRAYTASKNVAFVDASSVLRRLGKEAYATAGPHLSPNGYKVVSDLILEEIGKQSAVTRKANDG